MRDITLEDTIYIRFLTKAFATNIPTTLLGTPVLSIYEENNLTQITTGVSVTVDYDGVTGLNQATVVATAANDYENGKSYDLIITTGTVDGVSVVGDVKGSFTVGSSAAAVQIGVAGVGLTAVSLAATGLDAIASTATGMVEIAKAIWDRVISKANHDISQSAGKRVRNLTSAVIRNETAQGSGTGNNQIQFDTGASGIDGAYDPAMIAIISGTGAGQTRNIFQYDGTTKTATVDRNWKMNPDATSEFNIIASAGREHVNEGLAQAGTSTTITLNTLASASDNTYIGQMVFIRSGTGDDQARLVTAYNGTSKIAILDRAWNVTPDTTSAYVMLPISPVLIGATTHTGAIIPTVSTLTGHTAQTGDNFPLTNVLPDSGALSDLASILTLLNSARTEPGQGTPPVNPNAVTKLDYLYKIMRNKKDGDGTTNQFYADDGTTVDHKQTTSESAGTVTKGEIVTGP